MPASVLNQAAYGLTSGNLTVSATGNLILAVVFRTGSATQFPSSLTGPVGSWTAIRGTLGTSGEEISPGAYFMSAYYGYATATGTQTISVTFNGSTPGTVYLFLVECGDIATANAILNSIGHQQSSLAPGTNVVTVSGGTGSNNVSTQPALVLMFGQTTGGSLTASAGFTQNLSATARLIESQRVITTGAFNSTATLSGATATVSTFQIILAEQSSSNYSIGEVLQGSFSGGSGSQAMTTTCNVGDLIVVITQLSNVSGLVHVGVSDTVNVGNYVEVKSFFPGSGNTCIDIDFIACNTSGTPTIMWSNTGTYNNAIFQIIRVTGFTSAPVLDVASVVQTSGTGTAISSSTTLAQSNELAMSTNFYGQPINFGSQSSGWTDTGVSASGNLRFEYYKGGVTGAQTFSATASASGTWYNILFGFYSGVTLGASAGVFSMTGEAAIFTLGQFVSGSASMLANPGAFNWNGAQSQSQFIFLTPFGQYFWNGQNANLVSSTGTALVLNASTGFFQMTGIDQVLQGSVYQMTEFPGVFVMTGIDATFTIGSQVIIPPGFEVLPNLVGLDWLTASAVLWYGGYAELQPEIVKGTPIQMQEGIVVGQTPSALAIVPVGCAVTLSVASSNLLSVSFERH